MRPTPNHSADRTDMRTQEAERYAAPAETNRFVDLGGGVQMHRGTDDGLVHNHNWAVSGR